MVDDHYIYYWGQESLRRNGIALIVNKRVLNAVLGCSLTVVQVYALTSNAEEAEVEWFYEDLQDLLELTPQKRGPFIIGSWNAKVGSQETPGVTGKLGLGVQNETWQRLTVLPRECTGHSKHHLPETQEKTLHMDITRLSILKSGWLYSLQPEMKKLYTVRKNKTRSWL